MVIQESELEYLVRRLREVTTKIEDMRSLFDEEDELRALIKEYMIEHEIMRETVHDMHLTVGTRKYTKVIDAEQLKRTLTGRGVLEECLIFDMPKVRKILGDEALGLETTEQKYLMIRGKNENSE